MKTKAFRLRSRLLLPILFLVAANAMAMESTRPVAPGTQYLPATNESARRLIEPALRNILHGEPPCEDPGRCPIPDDRNWDRYDYADAASSWVAPFARGGIAGSNNGMTLQQIVGYRTILMNTGTYTSGCTDDSGYALFDSWLMSPMCDSNQNRQAFLMNGDGVGQVLEYLGPHGVSFMHTTLGAALICDGFSGLPGEHHTCPPPVDLSYCVRHLPSGSPMFPSSNELDAFGNGCPDLFMFNVLGPSGTGRGNRGYQSEDGAKQMDFSQIANENLAADANYRTVIDGVSWHHSTLRNPEGQGLDRCPRDFASIVSAIAEQIGADLRWAYDAPATSSRTRRWSS